MSDKYINQTGLSYYHNRIKNIFAKETDLSDLSDRVDDIVAEGGEPNVIEEVQKNGTALPVSGKAVNVIVPTRLADLSDGSNVAHISDIPTATSDLTNDGDGQSIFATQTYVDANGGKIDTISVNNTPQIITNKNVNITVPTATSSLTNDSGFQTLLDVETLIDEAIADVTQFEYEIVQTLPASGVKGTIYLMLRTGSVDDYDEYIWLENSWEKIGHTGEIDLSDYWNKTELVAITTAEIDTIISGV